MLAAPFALAGCTAATPVASPSPTPTATTIALDECLVGDWTADAGFAGDFMEHVILEQMPAVENGPTAARAEGTVSLSFASDHTFRYSPDIVFEIDYPLAGTQTGDLTGEASGTWQTIDDNLVSTVEQTDILLRKSLGGDPVPFNGVDGWENVPIAVSEMTCDGDHLDAAFNLINTSFTMELTRQG
jgi:hypothetical protein